MYDRWQSSNFFYPPISKQDQRGPVHQFTVRCPSVTVEPWTSSSTRGSMAELRVTQRLERNSVTLLVPRKTSHEEVINPLTPTVAIWPQL